MTTMLLAKINIVDNIFLLILGTVFAFLVIGFYGGNIKDYLKIKITLMMIMLI